MSDLSTPPPVTAPADAPHWTARHGKPIVFVILTMVAVGIYLALTIPVAVFPDTDFPRIVIGIFVMCAFVVVINRLFWRPLYYYAERKYRHALQGTTGKHVGHAEYLALVLVEHAGHFIRIDTGHGNMRADPVDDNRHQQKAKAGIIAECICRRWMRLCDSLPTPKETRI